MLEKEKGAENMGRGFKPFRFESMCIGQEACTNIIESAWASNQQVPAMVQQCGRRLTQWNKATFENIQVKLKKA